MRVLYSLFLLFVLLFGFISAAEVSKPQRPQMTKAEFRNKLMNPFSDIWMISYANALAYIDGVDSVANMTMIDFKTAFPIAANKMLLLDLRTGVRADSDSDKFLGLGLEHTSLTARVATMVSKRFSYALGGSLALPNNEDINNGDKLNGDVTFAPNVFVRYDGDIIDINFGMGHSFDIIDTDNTRESLTHAFAALAFPVMDSSDVMIGTFMRYDWTEANENRFTLPIFISYNFLAMFFGHPVQLRFGAGRSVIKAEDQFSSSFLFIAISPVLKH